jgi:hypothetical protein
MKNIQQRRPFPDTKNIEAALENHFACLGPSCLPVPADDRLYKIEEAFGTVANYWKDEVPHARFENMKDPSILYRPKVTSGASFLRCRPSFGCRMKPNESSPMIDT